MEETKQTSGVFQGESKKPTNVMALLSYIGPLCLIPILQKTQDDFVKFHAKQGLTIFAGEVITWIVVAIIPILWFFANIAGILWLVLSIIGIMNVVKNEKKEIPITGKFADKFKI
jgi:fumarate reductase subunit D